MRRFVFARRYPDIGVVCLRLFLPGGPVLGLNVTWRPRWKVWARYWSRRNPWG